MSKVAVLSTGGTIAMRVAPGEAGATLHGGFDMLAILGGSHSDIAITHHELFSKPSASVTLTDVQAIADAVHRQLEQGCSGVVVTHGTDTIEETALALSLVMARGEPVVLTGAMRSGEQPGADGLANLASAILVAASAQAARPGARSAVRG